MIQLLSEYLVYYLITTSFSGLLEAFPDNRIAQVPAAKRLFNLKRCALAESDLLNTILPVAISIICNTWFAPVGFFGIIKFTVVLPITGLYKHHF